MTYENPDYDISIQYPNDWTPSEDNLLPRQVVTFSAPEIEEKESSVSTIIYIPANLVVAVQPLYSPNMTMNQFVGKFLSEAYSSPNDYKIIESSNTTFAGMPAQKIIMYEYGEDSTSKVRRTIGIHNGTAYMIKYLAEPGQFDTYLPTAQAMIDSFQPSIRQQITGVPRAQLNDIVSNMTQDGNAAEPITTSSVPQQEDSILAQLGSGSTGNPTQLPETLLLSDNTGDHSRLPIVYSIENDRIATEVSDTTSSQFQGDIYGWIPGLTFNFDQPSKIGLMNIKNLLIGQIKNYESQEDILEETTYWHDIPLNEEVFLPLDHTGLNYAVAEVQFMNNTSGIYSTVLKVEPDQDTKFLAEYWMEQDMDEGAEYSIVDDSDIDDAELSPAAQGTYSAIICQHLAGYGFQTCSDNTISGNEPDTKVIYPENGNNNQGEEDENEEDEDEDNGDEDDEDDN